MKISNRLKLAFGTLVLILVTEIILNQIISYRALATYHKLNSEIEPVVKTLEQFEAINRELYLLALTRIRDIINQNRIRGILDVELPNFKAEIFLLKKDLPVSDPLIDQANSIIKKTDTIIKLNNTICKLLVTPKDFADSSKTRIAKQIIENKLDKISFNLEQELSLFKVIFSNKYKSFNTELANELKTVSNIILITGTLGILIGVIIAVQVILSIERPLCELLEATSKITKGDLNVIIKTKGRSEIAKLGNSFNEMNLALKKSFAELKLEKKALANSKNQIEEVVEQLEYSNKELIAYKVELDQQIFAINKSALISITDPNGTIIEVNDEFCKLSEYTREELIGQNHRILKSGKQPQSLFVGMWKAITMGKVWHGEIMNKKKHGKFYWVKATIVPFKNKDGEIEKFLAVRFDITREKQQQQELKIEKDRAEEALRVKSRFLANMSHEIRTPLNGIVGLTNLLLGTDLNTKQKEYLNAITTSSDTLLVVINDILDISKIEAGKMILEQKAFNLRNTILSVVEIFNTKAIENNSVLKTLIQEDVPEFVSGDSVRLNQILFNLVGNAIKFTQNGEVYISVELKHRSQEEATVRFTVKDTGRGIPESKLKIIFEPFSQVNDNSNRQFGGTGLGLSIVKKLIDLHNGILGVESEEGVGSTFYFELSYKLAQETFESKDKVYNEIHESSLEGINILVAEDNPLNQIVVVNLLKEEGAHVYLAKNGKEAIDLLKENYIDIILMDMQMPVMDGYEAMRIIRTQLSDEKSKIPIIALTAHVIDGEIKKCKDAGANDYEAKPFNPKALFLKIKSWHSIKTTI